MPTVYMLIGVPASGKSTWLAKQDLTNAVVLSTDNYVEKFAQLNNKTYTEIFQSVIGEATRLMQEDLRVALRERKDIYWDQTNLRVKARAGKLAQIPGTYEKVAVYCPTPSDAELARRLAARPGKTIPTNVVMGMKSQLEPPSESEGFDRIVTVNT